MNKIYKIVWNKTKKCYCVVSEITKSKGKSGRTVKMTAALLSCIFAISPLSVNAALTADQQAVYNAVIEELAKTSGETKVGNLTIDKANNKISYPQYSTDGNVNGVTSIDGKNHDFKLGLMHFDGYRGNLYLDGNFARNEVGNKQSYGFGGMAGSNIAWGSANVAGIKLVEKIEKRIIDGEEKDVVVGYKRDRTAPSFNTPLWNLNKNDQAGGGYSTAIGFYNAAYGVGTFAIGQYNAASGSASFVGGKGSYAIGNKSFAFGENVKAIGDNSVVFGRESEALGDDSYAFGYKAKAKADDAIAIGSNTEATKRGSLALGLSSKATNNGAVAIGSKANASGFMSFASGEKAKASGERSVALGQRTKAAGENAFAIGAYSYAIADNSLALAGGTVENGADEGIAIGYNAVTKVAGGFAIGKGSLADRDGDVYGYNPITGEEFNDSTIGAMYDPSKAEEIKNLNEEINAKTAEINAVAEEYNRVNAEYDAMIKGTGIEFTTENYNRLKAKLDELDAKYEQLDSVYSPLVQRRRLITGAYKSSAAAISIGNAETGMTRQLTGLAAGTKDTDAVNVAQLKALDKKWEKKIKNLEDNAGGKVKVEGDSETGVKVTEKNDTGTTTPNTGTTTPNTGTITPNTGTTTPNTGTTNTGTSSVATRVTQRTPLKPTTRGASGDPLPAPNVNPTNPTNGKTTYVVSLDEKITVGKFTMNGKAGSEEITSGNLKISAKSGKEAITGLSNKTWDGENFVSGRAATEDQLKQLEQKLSNVTKNMGKINKLGAKSAALSALHPLDFDPEDKWGFSAAVGNYNGENAYALGAFYQPNEKTLFSLGTTIGNGDNAVNFGISMKFGKESKLVKTRIGMAYEIKELTEKNEKMQKENEEMKKELEMLKQKVEMLISTK